MFLVFNEICSSSPLFILPFRFPRMILLFCIIDYMTVKKLRVVSNLWWGSLFNFIHFSFVLYVYFKHVQTCAACFYLSRSLSIAAVASDRSFIEVVSLFYFSLESCFFRFLHTLCGRFHFQFCMFVRVCFYVDGVGSFQKTVFIFGALCSLSARLRSKI